MNKLKNGYLPAFAAATILEGSSYCQEGLTKREYFAAMAMQGLLANSGWTGEANEYAELSIRLADELLKQLEQ